MNDVPKNIKDLNLEDDFLFAKVMSDNEICRRVLEQILNISIKKVESPITQKTIDLLLDGKGIRLMYMLMMTRIQSIMLKCREQKEKTYPKEQDIIREI